MTLTIEELKYGAEVGDLGIEAVRAVCAEALANREAQPVAWSYEWASCITCEGPQNFKPVIEREAPSQWAIDEGLARNVIPLYTAPPAPAVPEDLVSAVNRLLDCDGTRGHFSAIRCGDAREEVERLLAQPVSSGYKLPGGWMACSDRMPTPFVDVIASDGKQTICAHVIEDRWWCIVSETAEEPGPIIFWMPLPAAPEGGNG
ncbi:MAG: hypothetical protein ACRC2L_14770 [Serratia nevei]